MKKRVAFVCVHNSCRSQMAEGWAKKLGDNVIEPYSAGTEVNSYIKPLAIEVMSEVGIDISKQYSKLLKEIPSDIDILITMGCNVICPVIPSMYSEDWGLEDPSGKGLEEFRETRNLIKKKMEDLIYRIEKGDI